MDYLSGDQYFTPSDWRVEDVAAEILQNNISITFHNFFQLFITSPVPVLTHRRTAFIVLTFQRNDPMQTYVNIGRHFVTRWKVYL